LPQKSSYSKKTLEFKHVIALCYGRQQSLALQGCVPSPQVGAITQVVVDTLGLVVQQYVLNQSQGYWLFSNAFIFVISLVCQMQLDCMGLDSSEIQDFDGELHLFQQWMQKQVVQVLNPFLSFMAFFQRPKLTIRWQ
jgi:hypothetical protein